MQKNTVTKHQKELIDLAADISQTVENPERVLNKHLYLGKKVVFGDAEYIVAENGAIRRLSKKPANKKVRRRLKKQIGELQKAGLPVTYHRPEKIKNI